MDWIELLHCFELNDDGIVYQEIKAIATIQLDSSVNHRQCLLPLDLESNLDQLVDKASFVGRFQ